MLTKIALTLFSIVASAMSSIALAQESYPSKSTPIRVIAGFAPGGSADIMAHLIAQNLSKQMNTAVIVDYKIGNDNHIAVNFVAKSKPDGYNIALPVNTQVLAPAFGLKLDYNMFEELRPVSLLSSSPQVLAVHPSVPVQTTAEFIAYARAHPDQLAYSTPGLGSANHLSTLLFLQSNGLTALHAPYKGSGPAVIAVVAGEVQFGLLGVVPVLPLQKANRLKVLAITSLTRSPLLPDVPTLNETVMPKFEAVSWLGASVPAKTPSAIVSKLNEEMVKALRDPVAKANLAAMGLELRGSTPEAFGAFLKNEFETWQKVIKSADLKISQD